MAAQSEDDTHDAILDTMHEGVKAILELHTDEELAMVWPAFSNEPVPPERSERIGAILSDVTVSFHSVRLFLSTVWDGILGKYREAQGFRVPGFKTDVRQLIYKEWTSGASSAPGKGGSFHAQPVFVPKTPSAARDEDEHEEAAILDIGGLEEEERRMREEIGVAEQSFKDAERQIRRHRDASALFHFLDMLRELRRIEAAWRERMLSLAKHAVQRKA